MLFSSLEGILHVIYRINFCRLFIVKICMVHVFLLCIGLGDGEHEPTSNEDH